MRLPLIKNFNKAPIPHAHIRTICFMLANQIVFVDVLKGTRAAIYGSRGAAGVIIITTKRGS